MEKTATTDARPPASVARHSSLVTRHPSLVAPLSALCIAALAACAAGAAVDLFVGKSPAETVEVPADLKTGEFVLTFDATFPKGAPRQYDPFTWGRTPFVLAKSTDDGRTWSKPVIVEDDPHRGYCYPSFFFTRDSSLLLSYCRGGHECANCLCRLGIMKIALDEL